MKKEHFYAVLAICAVILALAAIVKGQALSAAAPLLGAVEAQLAAVERRQVAVRRFVVPGPPVPKQWARRDARGRWYTPTRTRRYEEEGGLVRTLSGALSGSDGQGALGDKPVAT